MIVYSGNKRMFIEDVRDGIIADKIQSLLRERGLTGGQDREFDSWHNSMQFMRNIVDDPKIADDVQVAIEYNIPHTSKRVDFIILGSDETGKDNIVIVELKQWSKAEIVDDQMHYCVRTYVANDKIWAINPSSFEEVGCIHTAQGLEFEYVGVILGKDIYYDATKGAVMTDKTAISADDHSSGIRSASEQDAARLILNTYKTLLTRGQKGCYVYCEDDALRAYFKSFVAKNYM